MATPHGNLFTMGWLRAPLSDFILLCILAKKKINTTLIYFMLFFILIQTGSPQNRFICSPLASPPCHSSCPIPPLSHCVFWLIVVCSLSSGSHLMHEGFYFHHFCHILWCPKTTQKCPPSIHSATASSHLKHPPPSTLFFGWLFLLFLDLRPPKAVALPITLFFYGSGFDAQIKPHSSK